VPIDEKHINSLLQGINCLRSTFVSLAQHEQPVWEEKVCSHPVLIPKNLTEKLEDFHQALALALTHIIERWGGKGDSSDSLSARMPLMREEEDLIQVFVYFSIGLEFN
jgi:hypothetical protein